MSVQIGVAWLEVVRGVLLVRWFGVGAQLVWKVRHETVWLCVVWCGVWCSVLCGVVLRGV